MALASPIRWVQPSAEPTAVPEAAQPGEWNELPAIERASGKLDLTARSRTFVRGLASQRPARATLAPLRGGRSLEAPHGLVRGIARALDGARRDGPELAPAPARARRRRAAIAGQNAATSAPAPVIEHEADAEHASTPSDDVGLGAVDLPESRPRVVQAVTSFGRPAAPVPTALISGAESVPEPPAGRILRAPLVLDRSEAHVSEAGTVAVAPSAAPDFSAASAGPSPGPPLSEFVPRRLRRRSSPPPAPVEPEPAPRPAAATESDVEAPGDEPEAPGLSGTPEPMQVTSFVTAARSLAARPVTSTDEVSSGVRRDAAPPAPADTSTRAVPIHATEAPAPADE